MRQERIIQASLFDGFARHDIGRELKAVSQRLDAHRGLLGVVASDLRRSVEMLVPCSSTLPEVWLLE